ncbi:MAG: transporter [Gemmatimonadetes bacterium]|nr:transporter [Gemmatimonadota bacterium]
MLARRCWVACAAILAAAPLSAQDYVWTDNRPDAAPPTGIVADRALPAGAVELRYIFSNTKFDGVQFGTDLVAPITVLDFYDSTPFQRRDRMHRAVLSFGASESFTLVVDAAWVDRNRDVADEQFFIETSAAGLADVTAEGLFQVYEGDATRVSISAGVELPVGSTDKMGDLLVLQEQILPYEMQPGSGSISAVPGVSAMHQNSFGTVGAQIKARLRLNDNDRDYRLGDVVEANGWLGYRLNDFFAITSGVRALSWGSIAGVPDDVDIGRDPGEDPIFSGGKRVEIPLGLNVLMPEGGLEGHRLSVEFIWPVHQDYDNFRIAQDWGFSVGWQKMF